MMSTTEALLSYTTKVKGTDLLTARGDTEDEFIVSYEAMLRIKNRIEGGTATVEQAVETVKAAIPGTREVADDSQSETKEDQWGNKFANVAGLGACAHGPRIRAERTNREGAAYERWECINNTPFRVGKFDANAVCKHEYPPKKSG
jgi:hypothetical protein